MAESLLNLKNRITTVESIKKITNAMKLIASSRYTRLKSLYDANIEYTNEMKDAMEVSLKYVNYGDKKLPTCLIKNSGDKKLFILVSPTLGLCGSYFYNIQKLAQKEIKPGDDVIFIGEKGYKSFKNQVNKHYDDFVDLLDNFTFSRVNAMRHFIEHAYLRENYSSVNIIYTQYLNSMSTKAICEEILPLKYNENPDLTGEIEPTVDREMYKICDLIVPHYLDALLYHLLLESSVSEQTCRKNSMENATTSAEKLIYNLKLEYNNIRQQNITNEITEIISGSGDSLNFI